MELRLSVGRGQAAWLQARAGGHAGPNRRVSPAPRPPVRRSRGPSGGRLTPPAGALRRWPRPSRRARPVPWLRLATGRVVAGILGYGTGDHALQRGQVAGKRRRRCCQRARHSHGWSHRMTASRLAAAGMDLHPLVFWLAATLCVVVEVLLVTAEVRQQRAPRQGELADAPGRRGRGEVLWLLGPALLLGLLIVLTAPAALRLPPAPSGLTPP